MGYRHLAAVTQGDYRDRIARCRNHILKNGTYKGQRFGGIPLKAISPAFADSIYDEYLPKQKTNDQGNVVEFNRAERFSPPASPYARPEA